MQGFINRALDHSRTVLMIFVLLIVSGVVTYITIAKEANPDINIPVIYVSIVHDGISPEDAERLLVGPMERELRGIEGVKEMTSSASEGHASVTLEFIAGFNTDKAIADVRDKVTVAKGKLPSETEEPTINQVTMADEQAVITVILSGSVSQRALLTTARRLKNELESYQEILEVDIGGEREDMMEIIVEPLLMESYDLDILEIAALVSNNNSLVPAGNMSLERGQFAVKIPAVVETIQDLMEMPIKAVGNRVVTFQDVAKIRRAYKDPSTIARLNGEPAVALEVKKRPGENIIFTVDNVKQLFTELRKQPSLFPDAIKVTYIGDMSKDIKIMLSDLQNNVLSAVLLVVIVIIAILGLRTAGLVGIAIPGSFLTGILLISLFGYTLNMVVLFSLIMSVGMLVDGAIVVTEYADRCMTEGMQRKQAYAEASKRMCWPIVASTATTLAAFAPLMFWPGMMGEFMKYLPFTLIATLSASLLMALIFVPTLGALLGKTKELSAKEKRRLELSESGDLMLIGGFSGTYARALNRAVHNPLKILASALGITVLVFWGYGRAGLGAEFFPDVDVPFIEVNIRSYGDLSVYEKDTLVLDVEKRIEGVNGIESIYSRSGGGNVGYILVSLKDWQLRTSANNIVAELKQRLTGMSGLEVEVKKVEDGPQSGKDIAIELSALDSTLLPDAVRTLRKAMAADPALTAIDDDSNKPGIEWRLLVNRTDAARYGADATLVGNIVQFATTGLRIGTYRPDDVDDEIDIRVRYPTHERFIDKLDNLRVRTASGMIPISYFVERQAAKKTDVIRHVGGQRVITISANMSPDHQLVQELPRLKESFANLGLDPLVNVRFRGQNEDQQESQTFLIKAFLIALFVMAIILVTQFNSFYQAFLILSAVLFSTAGVFLGLLLSNTSFGIVMSGIGVIALAGIVVNNNIVLIDTYNILRKQGHAAYDAVLRTGVQRLRPVLMTTVTTILGLMPMVMQVNIDLFGRKIEIGAPSTEWWTQLSSAIVYGLAFATFLTLFLTPCLLMLGEKLRKHRY